MIPANIAKTTDKRLPLNVGEIVQSAMVEAIQGNETNDNEIRVIGVVI